MDTTPIVVSQLGRPRDAVRVEVDSRPLVVAGGLALAGLALAAAVGSPLIDRHGDLAAEVVRAVVVAGFAAAGMSAVARRPIERQGLLVVIGAFLGATAEVLDALIRAHAGGVAVGAGLLALARLGEPLALGLLPVAIMHFLLGLPDGSCRLGRTVVTGGYVVGAAVGLATWAAGPALPLWPFGLELLVAVPVGVFGSQRRYARSVGVERQRLQWFGWAVTVGAETLLVALALRLLWGWPTRAPLVVAAACLPMAVAVSLGSSRRANRIDRMLTHTVSLAGLTGVVVAVFLVVVVGLGGTPTRSDRSLIGLSMAAAAVSALLYGPARRRLGLYANRVVYGEREAPDAVLRTFGSRLSRAVPMDELLLQVAESLRKTLGLRAAEVWTGSHGHLERSISVPDVPHTRVVLTAEEQTVVAQAGVTGTAWVEVWLPALLEGREGSLLRVAPTTHSGQLLGLIVAVRDAASDQFTPDDDLMLTELARQIGLALHNVELDSALQETLDEVRRQADQLQASRARIVAASDAARRQIERNLHDGAQQHLVALAVNVRLARRLAETDLGASLEILDDLGRGLQDAVQELRALAHGIYPPLLIDRGVPEALRAAAGRSALPMDVSAEGLGRYSPEEEAAVYFCCMEAMQNAAKHAGPEARIDVRVWEDAGLLCFEVADDGAGFDTAKAGGGAGFVNMSDRVGAIGGTLHVTSAAGAGTTVAGRIPVSP